MQGPTLVDRLKQRFGDKIPGANLEAIDPWIEVAPEGLPEVCLYLRDEPDLRFDFLSLISGV
ncbi:MAG TPA: NADH-quinone oxidoreductase subunit C, partial [Pirellulales bacterium]